MELRNKVESILFSAGKRIHIDELARLCHAKKEDVLKALGELKDWYNTKEESLMVAQEGDFWKLTVREKYLGLVRKIVTATELSKTIMETLAVVAWKAPVKQSEVIKLRTNKAYDHLKELEEADYITREKHGRTKLIKLSKKFFEYFDIPEDKLKDRFKSIDEMAKAIEEKEAEIEAVKKEQEEQAKTKEVDVLDKEGHEVALKQYDLSEEERRKALLEKPPKIEKEKQMLGDLEVVEEAERKEKEETEEEPELALEPEEEPEEALKPETKEKPAEKEEESSFPIQQEEPEKPKEPEEERVLEIPKEAVEEAEEPEKKPKKEEKKEDEIEEALEEIEEEEKEEAEKPKEKEKAKPTEEAEADFEKRAEKRSEEILHPTKEEPIDAAVEDELDSMLHPPEGAKKKEEHKEEEEEQEEEPEKETPEEQEPKKPSKDTEKGLEKTESSQKEKKAKKKKKKPMPEKPDFEDEVKTMVEEAGEEKVELPKKVEEPEEE